MKTKLILLGAMLCLAGTSNAVLWTGEIYFTTLTAVDGADPVFGYGYAPIGETMLWNRYLFDAPSNSPNGHYVSGLSFDHTLALIGHDNPTPLDLISTVPIYDRWPMEMSVRNGIVEGFWLTFDDFDVRYYSNPDPLWEETYWWEHVVGGTLTITDPCLVHPIPDTGSTLPILAIALLGLALTTRKIKNHEKTLG